MNAEPQTAEAEYYVLKRGDTFGPFSHQDLVVGLESGKFAPGDFVQIEGETSWAPLNSVLGGHDAVPGAEAPSWETIFKVGWLRLRNTVEERSFVAGGVCLGVGTACLILARWPFVFWAPWFAAAAVAAAVLLRRKRRTPGALVLLAALCIPLAVWIFPLKTNWRAHPLPSRPSTASSATRNSPVPPPPPAAAPSPGSQASADIPGLPSPGPADASPAPTLQEAPPAPARVAPHYAKEPVATPVARYATGAPAPGAPAPPVAPAASATPAAPAPPGESPSGISGVFSWLSSLFGSGHNPAPPAEPIPPPQIDASALERDYASSLVLASGDEGSGSGFICKNGSTTFLYTNIHVVAKFKGLTFTRIDGPILSPGRGELATGRDVARFEVTPVPPKPLEMMTNFDTNVRIGDAVAVLGNSGGGGVVTALRGKINGIGPDRIEVSAEFIPGNSGSPIIHLDTGKVIGIATYAIIRSAEPKSAMDSSVRRFGYRIDNAAAWEGISWPAFQRDVETLKKISLVTDDLITLLRSFPNTPGQAIHTESLRRDYADWASTMRTSKIKAEQNSATDRFLREIKFLGTTDVPTAEQQLTYTYFREDLVKQKKVRTQITTAIDNAENMKPSSLTSGHL